MHNDEIAERVLRAIRRIVRQTSEHSRQLARNTGLTTPQLLCLRAIAQAAPDAEVTVAAVSQHVQLSAATVSRILDRLERAGMIMRERRSRDRRKVCLSLTDLGRQRLAEVPSSLQEKFVQRLANLSRHEQIQLLASLELAVQLMEAESLDVPPMLESDLDIQSLPH